MQRLLFDFFGRSHHATRDLWGWSDRSHSDLVHIASMVHHEGLRMLHLTCCYHLVIFIGVFTHIYSGFVVVAALSPCVTRRHTGDATPVSAGSLALYTSFWLLSLFNLEGAYNIYRLISKNKKKIAETLYRTRYSNRHGDFAVRRAK